MKVPKDRGRRPRRPISPPAIELVLKDRWEDRVGLELAVRPRLGAGPVCFANIQIVASYHVTTRRAVRLRRR
jgi:hypothetical protein